MGGHPELACPELVSVVSGSVCEMLKQACPEDAETSSA